MRLLKAFFLGAMALGVVVYAAAVTIGIAVTAAGDTIRLAVGPLVIVAVEQIDGGTATTLGPGLALVAIAGGLVNAAVAYLLVRRRSRRSIA